MEHVLGLLGTAAHGEGASERGPGRRGVGPLHGRPRQSLSEWVVAGFVGGVGGVDECIDRDRFPRVELPEDDPEPVGRARRGRASDGVGETSHHRSGLEVAHPSPYDLAVEWVCEADGALFQRVDPDDLTCLQRRQHVGGNDRRRGRGHQRFAQREHRDPVALLRAQLADPRVDDLDEARTSLYRPVPQPRPVDLPERAGTDRFQHELAQQQRVAERRGPETRGGRGVERAERRGEHQPDVVLRQRLELEPPAVVVLPQAHDLVGHRLAAPHRGEDGDPGRRELQRQRGAHLVEALGVVHEEEQRELAGPVHELLVGALQAVQHGQAIAEVGVERRRAGQKVRERTEWDRARRARPRNPRRGDPSPRTHLGRQLECEPGLADTRCTTDHQPAAGAENLDAVPHLLRPTGEAPGGRAQQ